MPDKNDFLISFVMSATVAVIMTITIFISMSKINTNTELLFIPILLVACSAAFAGYTFAEYKRTKSGQLAQQPAPATEL